MLFFYKNLVDDPFFAKAEWLWAPAFSVRRSYLMVLSVKSFAYSCSTCILARRGSRVLSIRGFLSPSVAMLIVGYANSMFINKTTLFQSFDSRGRELQGGL